MNVLNVIDREGEVTNVAAEAQIALQTGDTARSAQLFRQAGEMLESSVARLTKPSERSLARFLAATHYYKGGAYQEATRVCDRIRERRLPSRVRHLYPPFLKDVEERSAPDYPAKYARESWRTTIGEPGTATVKAAQKVIDLLIAHPYLSFLADRMAYMEGAMLRCTRGDRRGGHAVLPRGMGIRAGQSASLARVPRQPLQGGEACGGMGDRRGATVDHPGAALVDLRDERHQRDPRRRDAMPDTGNVIEHSAISARR